MRLTIGGPTQTPVRSVGAHVSLRAENGRIFARDEEGRAARFGPEQPAFDTGRGVHYKTWDIEGSPARRVQETLSIRGTPIGGVAPGPRIDRVSWTRSASLK